MWQVRLYFCANLFLQVEHANVFSPVWILICSKSRAFCVNPFTHNEHRYGLSPVWTRRCTLRLPFWEKLFPQTEHLNAIPAFVIALLCDISPSVKCHKETVCTLPKFVSVINSSNLHKYSSEMGSSCKKKLQILQVVHGLAEDCT